MQRLLDILVPSGGDAGGVTGVVNFIPSGFGSARCLLGMLTAEGISMASPVWEVCSEEKGGADAEAVVRSTDGGGVGVAFGSRRVAMAR